MFNSIPKIIGSKTLVKLHASSKSQALSICNLFKKTTSLPSPRRSYAVKKPTNTKYKPPMSSSSNAGPAFHLPKNYRPAVPSPHDIDADKAAAIALAEHERELASRPKTIEDLRRKAGAEKAMAKLIQELQFENEDPLIRQAYEELEDEDRARKGLPPLKRAPPGKLKKGTIAKDPGVGAHQ